MNKKLILLFVALTLVVLLVVLNSTVFVVSEISVESDDGSSWYDQDEVIAASKINIGQNIFAVSEKKAIENTHVDLTSVRVINIERVFPNKVIIHIIKRIPIVSIQITDETQYLITDCDLRIMDIQDEDGNEYIQSTKIIGLSIDVEGERDQLIGKVITNRSFDYIINIAQAALVMGIDDVGFSSFFDYIDFSFANYMHIKTNSGTTLVLVIGTDTSIEDQFQAAYSLYVSYSVGDPKRNNGYIIITEQGWKWQESIE